MPKTVPAKFIVIEALDAGGSQTQTDKLAKRLKREQYNVLQLHFPHEDRATGKLIYQKYLHDHGQHPFSRREQALLYIQDFYSRNEDITAHLQRRRNMVISDRYVTSTQAYQPAGLSGRRRDELLSWIDWLAWEGKPQLIKPDLVIFIDTPVAMVLERLKGKRLDLHEKRAKLTRFRTSYLDVAKRYNWHVVPGASDDGRQLTRGEVHDSIWQIIVPRLR